MQLRSHIPIAAPARREPADGTEATFRPVVGFEPAWFHKRCGVDFGARWHQDPFYRHDTLALMKKALCEAVPSLPQWDPDQAGDLSTISGCYGICPIPAAFGLPIRYAADRWPVLESGHHLSAEATERLTAESALSNPFVAELSAQMDAIEREWGPIHGYLNWQGVMNNAFHLRGPEVFVDLIERPDLARHLFITIREVMVRLAGLVQERQRQSGFPINQLDVSNCTINMLSPRTYAEFLFTHDERIARSFARFGVHTCNWNVTPYLQELRRLPNVGYLDMGMESDLNAVKAMFPEARRAVLYSPVTLQDARIEEIRSDLRRIFDQLAPCDVVFADIQWNTPDARVNEVVALCREIAATP